MDLIVYIITAGQIQQVYNGGHTHEGRKKILQLKDRLPQRITKAYAGTGTRHQQLAEYLVFNVEKSNPYFGMGDVHLQGRGVLTEGGLVSKNFYKSRYDDQIAVMNALAALPNLSLIFSDWKFIDALGYSEPGEASIYRVKIIDRIISDIGQF